MEFATSDLHEERDERLTRQDFASGRGCEWPQSARCFSRGVIDASNWPRPGYWGWLGHQCPIGCSL